MRNSLIRALLGGVGAAVIMLCMTVSGWSMSKTNTPAEQPDAMPCSEFANPAGKDTGKATEDKCSPQAGLHTHTRLDVHNAGSEGSLELLDCHTRSFAQGGGGIDLPGAGDHSGAGQFRLQVSGCYAL